MLAPLDRMWIVLGILLFVGWLLAKVVWNVATFGVHLLLAAAVVALVIHFVRGRARQRYRHSSAVT